MRERDNYLARAAEARADADAATLPNVKERCLRAEEAWAAMAARVAQACDELGSAGRSLGGQAL